MRTRVLLGSGLCLALLSVACSDKPVGSNETRQFGENCDEDNGCITGLICEGGLCRKLCSDNNDCPDDYNCEGGRCVKSTTAAPRKVGESCNDHLLCATGLECQDGFCKIPCKGPSDCQNGEVCVNGRCKPEEKLPERGERCNAEGKCATGLTCIENICQKSCNLDEECGDDNLICDKKICSPKPVGPASPTGREEPKMAQGGIITPVSGTIKNSNYKVRVVGGSLQGQTQNSNNNARLNDGAWKKEE